MPKLPTYTAPLGEGTAFGGRRATAEDFGALDFSPMAAATQKFAANYNALKEEDDQRLAIVENQKIRAEYAEALRQAEATGTSTDALKEKFQSRLSDIATKMTTRKGASYAEQYSAVSSEMFSHEARNIEIRSAGRKLTQQGKEFDAAAAQQLQMNPALLPQLLAEREALMQAYLGRVASPDLINEAIQEGRQLLTASAVQSLIELPPTATTGPTAALKLLQDPNDKRLEGLSPQQRATMINVAQTAERARISDEQRGKQLAREEQDTKNKAALDAMLVDFGEGKGRNWTATAILRQRDVDPSAKVHQLQVFEHLTKPKQGVNPQAANTAYTDIFRPDNDPRRIKNEGQIDALLTTGVIDPNHHRSLRAAFASREKPEAKLEGYFMGKVAEIINPRDNLGRIMQPNGPMNAAQFRLDMDKLREQWEKDSTKNPATLFDQTHKDYQSYTLPLINKYRATSVFVPNDKGGFTETPIPQPTDALPVIKSQKELEAFAGGDYRMPGDPPGKWRTKKPSGSGVRQIQGAPLLESPSPINADVLAPR